MHEYMVSIYYQVKENITVMAPEGTSPDKLRKIALEAFDNGAEDSNGYCFIDGTQKARKDAPIYDSTANRWL